MPWKECSVMSQRLEFCHLALGQGISFSELCRRFGISRSNGYKWLHRFQQAAEPGLQEQSRRPRLSPTRTPSDLEAAVVQLRQQYGWGGRKLHQVLLARLGQAPAPSTISDILRRHGMLSTASHPGPFLRFQRPQPNQLWQIDFKGHFATLAGRCHPLTVLDDHSRYALCVQGCGDETGATVQAHLSRLFECYGLPEGLLCDNGGPWANGSDRCEWSHLGLWLVRLGLQISHGRPYHPQTQGKIERFHRTLRAELIGQRVFQDIPHFNALAEPWREVYNHQRPHEALGLAVPASHYQPSSRRFPGTLPPIEYGPADQVRKVDGTGRLWFKGRVVRVGKALRGQPVALRATGQDGEYEVYFCHQKISVIDLRQQTAV